MGKKSKKKGGAANKAARKEKLQERREQQLDQLDQNSDDGGNNELLDNRRDREYFVGDRVWFKGDLSYCDGKNPNTYRGIVHAVDGDFVEITPLQALIDGDDYTQRIPTKIKPSQKMYVFPDFCDMTLRFDIGDNVICNVDDWVPASVSYLWPIEENDFLQGFLPATASDVVPHYECKMLFGGDYPTVTAPHDDDDYIQLKPTSFRFKVGDRVTFNSMKARGNTAAAANHLRRNAEWSDGKITSVDLCEEGLDYAVYECTFKVAAKKYSCFINDDDDEHIALVDADPRKRLFDAIEQDCSRDHFLYLTSHFNIDVAAFRDLVMTKAIEFASYNALTWLQHDCGIDVRLVRDKVSGDKFLHMIANSPFASRFIRKLAENSRYRSFDEDEATLNLVDYGNRPTTELNNNGEVWLQSLVRRGDIKALDVAFSPNCGLAWDDYFFFGDVLELVAGSIKESDNPIMQYIFDAFNSFRTTYQQLNALSESSRTSEEALLQDDRLAVFRGGDAKHGAKLLTRFYRDWNDRLSENLRVGRIFRELVQKGMARLFQLLYEADQGLFEMDDDYCAESNEDRQQFIQHELRTSKKCDVRTPAINIFNLCVMGSHSPIYCGDFQNYLWRVKVHFLNCEADKCPSLHHHLSRKKETKSSSSVNKCVTYRLRLLEDEDDVKGRQNILHYLLLKDEDVRLDVLFILRQRQCWALRFLVDKKYLDLEGLAAKDENLAQNASTLSFLNSALIPSNMTLRCCLSFAAVQYDDLQSLEWLSESGAPDDLVGGWNLLHYSAFMGRIEIIGWLSSQPVWNSLVSQASTRKTFVGAYAVHIAASCGHLHACDLLMGLKVPLEDKKGKLPEDYAKKSRHEFVREWAADRAKPQALKKDVMKLLRQVEEQKSVSQIKDFIISSQCLDIDNWCSCDWYSFDEELLGISFRDALHSCCKHSDIELAKWICFRLYFSCTGYAGNFWDRNDRAQNDEDLLSRDDLVSFARERGYDDLVDQIQGKWFEDISCSDPLTRDSILESALGGDERLVVVRAAILRIDLLENVAKSSFSAIKDILQRGGRVDELRELLRINASANEAVITEMGDILSDKRNDLFYSLRPFEMTRRLSQQRKHNPISWLLLFPEEGYGVQERAHIVLATEGYTELLSFCLSNVPGWNAAMELNVIRIASFFGHTSIVEMLLSPNRAFTLHSDEKERHYAAILGAGEALRYRDFEFLMNMQTDSIIGKRIEKVHFEALIRSDLKKVEGATNKSLIVAVLNGYAREFFDSDVDNKTALKTLRLLVGNHIYTNDDIIFAMTLLLDTQPYLVVGMTCILDLLQTVMAALGIQPISHSKQMQKICKKAVDTFRSTDKEVVEVTSFLEFMVSAGVDIQEIGEDLSYYSQSNFKKCLTNLQQKQRSDWSRFDIVKKGGSLTNIQQLMKDGGLTAESRDRGGLLLTHLSAAYDRVDLLEWLVVSEGIDLDALDAQHRTTLDVAKASKASLATKWIIERKAKAIIGSFLRRNYFHALRRRRLQKSKDAATLIQSVIRAYATRKIFANVLMRRMEESQHFAIVWGRVIASIDNIATSTCWADIREQLVDIKVGLDDEMLDDTDQKLSRAMEEAVQDECCGEDDELVPDESIDSEERVPGGVVTNQATRNLNNSSTQWLSFQMSSHVVKFLQQGDKKYRSFFVRRMRQLASGERSRILQKPLKGSKTLIYETYLEQKSGHRILWTEEPFTPPRIVIWYVAKHKQVSRLMQLIDDSKSRSARQQMPVTLVSELQNEGLIPQNEKMNVLLDIFGNVPLKVYDVNFNSINEITKESWTPQLHLTDEERDIVEAKGTVLVLGRSGTGKTICISSSIEFDRQSTAAHDPSFTQLFVARSVRLCRYVEGAVGEDNRTSFLTYARLLNDIESTLPGQTRNFNPSQKIDFGRFKRDFHGNSSSNEKISALILWTVIRTFLKGSIEAFQTPKGILPRDEFVEVERLGKNRCRIPVELREQVYDEFLQYQKYLQDEQLWDDCDRVRHLLLRMNHAKQEDPDAFAQVQRRKVYVDEVQDYTQLEILLFFYLSGPNGLFLAGDPAQSVVEGTEFRFEEVRGVGHFVGSVIQKPKTVNVNFRSHSGILNCAGGVLDLMFTHFPS
eukprot:scaffold22810_cov103-Skeletonema_dohrnii-CCMP3373.AAC.1